MIAQILEILRQSDCDRLRFEIDNTRKLLHIELLRVDDKTSSFCVDLDQRPVDLKTYEETIFKTLIHKFDLDDIENDVREI